MTSMIDTKTSQRGSMPIYITLLMIAVITSGAITMSGILSKQLRFAEDLTTSERAFYAANSGVEQALYALEQKRQDNDFSPLDTIEGTVDYEQGERATYKVSARMVANAFRTVVCVDSEGDFRGEKRRVQFGPPLDNCTVD